MGLKLKSKTNVHGLEELTKFISCKIVYYIKRNLLNIIFEYENYECEMHLMNWFHIWHK